MRRLIASLSVIAIAAVALGQVSAQALPAPAPTPNIVLDTASTMFFVNSGVYAVSDGSWQRDWNTPIGSTQTGDVVIRRFRANSGGSTSAFDAPATLTITTTPQSGQYLGEPSIFAVQNGLVFCRVNPPTTTAGTSWWVETAYFNALTDTWSPLKRDQITNIFGTSASCDGAVRRGDETTVIVGPSQNELNIGQTIYAVSRDAAGPGIVRPFTNTEGKLRGAQTSGSVIVSKNFSTGVTDLYRNKQIPVSLMLMNYTTQGSVRTRTSYDSLVMFDLDTHLWTTPVKTFGSTFNAAENVEGSREYSTPAAMVSTDGRSVTVVNTYKSIVSVPRKPTFKATSLTRSAIDLRAYSVGLSSADLARADLKASLGWYLSYTDGGRTRRAEVMISRVRSGTVVATLASGAQTPAFSGTPTNVTLQFTGVTSISDMALLEWTRAVESVRFAMSARVLTSDGLSREQDTPGSWSGDGNDSSRVLYTAELDSASVFISEEAGNQSPRTLVARALKGDTWDSAANIGYNVVAQPYPQPSVLFLPWRYSMAIVFEVGAPDQVGVTSVRAVATTPGIARYWYTQGNWRSSFREDSIHDDTLVGLPAEFTITGASSWVRAKVTNEHPAVPITSVSYDAAEHLPGYPSWGTLTYTYDGVIPDGATGNVWARGWTDATGWALGALPPVIDRNAHTVKVPDPITPQGAAPGAGARLIWSDYTQTLLTTY